MGKINHSRPSSKTKGKHIEPMQGIGATEELNNGFKKQFRERLKERKKQIALETIRIKSIFKINKPRLIKKRGG
tara:strand:- start:154 stop:375 length:222 start_codon:yes stop_codon:yes gene_type:complete